MTIQTLEQRLVSLRDLKRRIDAEIRRVESAVASQPRRRRGRAEIPPCGSNSAYQRHVYHHEEIDEDCRRAHREYQRAWWAQRAERRAS